MVKATVHKQEVPNDLANMGFSSWWRFPKNFKFCPTFIANTEFIEVAK